MAKMRDRIPIGDTTELNSPQRIFQIFHKKYICDTFSYTNNTFMLTNNLNMNAAHALHNFTQICH